MHERLGGFGFVLEGTGNARALNFSKCFEGRLSALQLSVDLVQPSSLRARGFTYEFLGKAGLNRVIESRRRQRPKRGRVHIQPTPPLH